MGRAAVTENEIRPDHFQREMADCSRYDLEWLLSHRREFCDCPCPACNGSSRKPMFEKDGFGYHACTDCRTGYISPRPHPALLKEFYAASRVYRLFIERIFPASLEVRREEFFRPRVTRVVEACSAAGIGHPDILEVGSAFGIFCEEAQKSGFFNGVIGIEPNRLLAERCRSRGIRVIEKMVEDVLAQEIGSVDVICAFEVIEHLFDPCAFLNRCRGFLRPNGILYLSCPNGFGFDLRMLGSQSDTYNFEHLNYFNIASLRRLFEQSGFQVIGLRTPGKLDVDLVRRAALSGKIDLTHAWFLKAVLVDGSEGLRSAFQEFLAANFFSGHMEAVARAA
jgi:2-polyprenyl-3-methyl-5-hydroxy-6-metoxy-1,4-benzoquinol methylase